MNQMLVGPMPLASLADVEEVEEPASSRGIDPVGILRELASAWKRLALVDE